MLGSIGVSYARRRLLSSGKQLRETMMEREVFQAWLAEADGLTQRQRRRAKTPALQGAGAVLVAAGRSGTTFTRVLPDTTALTVRVHLETAIAPDALLVTDRTPFFPPNSSDLGPGPWASPTSRSTTRPANAVAAISTSTPSTAATSDSRPSSAAAAASPPDISTATSPGIISRSCPSCRRRARCWPRWPGCSPLDNHSAWRTLIGPNQNSIPAYSSRKSVRRMGATSLE